MLRQLCQTYLCTYFVPRCICFCPRIVSVSNQQTDYLNQIWRMVFGSGSLDFAWLRNVFLACFVFTLSRI